MRKSELTCDINRRVLDWFYKGYTVDDITRFVAEMEAVGEDAARAWTEQVLYNEAMLRAESRSANP